MYIFTITFILSVLILVAGFLLPPTGIIDNSVLTAVGLLLMFAVLAQIPAILRAARDGRTIRFRKGDLSLEATGKPDASPPSDSTDSSDPPPGP